MKDSRRGLILILCTTLVAGLISATLAVDPLFVHGFAPACSDGYAEANGTAPCKPQWSEATPFLAVFGTVIAGAFACAARLARIRGGRKADVTGTF